MYRLRWALGLGVLILLTSPITIATAGDTKVAAIKAAVGAALIAVWFAVNRRRLFATGPRPVDVPGEKPSKAPMGGASRATFFFLSTALISIFAVGALGAINFIVNKRN